MDIMPLLPRAPRRFPATSAATIDTQWFVVVGQIHLGVYIGGALGTVAAVVAIIRERGRMRVPEEEGGRADRRW